MQETHSKRLNRLPPEEIERRAQLSLRWLRNDVPAMVCALTDFLAQVARDAGFGFAIIGVEQVRRVAARDFQHIAKAARGNEAGLDALTLCQRIDDNSGTVHKKRDIGAGYSSFFQGVEHPLRKIIRDGMTLDRSDLPVIQGNQVGKSATDICRNSNSLCHEQIPRFCRIKAPQKLEAPFRVHLIILDFIYQCQ